MFLELFFRCLLSGLPGFEFAMPTDGVGLWHDRASTP